MAKHPSYDCWRDMIRRCHDPKNKAYPAYGGSGEGNRIESPTGSYWEWSGAIRPDNGYGHFCIHRTPFLTHRLAYFIRYGVFDESLRVLHRCDNPPCVNPKHLFLGTDLDNIRDCIAKGRKRYQTAKRCEEPKS